MASEVSEDRPYGRVLALLSTAISDALSLVSSALWRSRAGSAPCGPSPGIGAAGHVRGGPLDRVGSGDPSTLGRRPSGLPAVLAISREGLPALEASAASVAASCSGILRGLLASSALTIGRVRTDFGSGRIRLRLVGSGCIGTIIGRRFSFPLWGGVGYA